MCLWWFFWKRLVFESVDWVKRSTLTSVGRHQPIQLRAWIEHQREKRVNSISLCMSWDLLSSDSSIPGSQDYGLRLRFTSSAPGSWAFRLGMNKPLDFLSLQLEDGKLWDFSASMTTWANFYNLSLWDGGRGEERETGRERMSSIGSFSLESPNTEWFK